MRANETQVSEAVCDTDAILVLLVRCKLCGSLLRFNLAYLRAVEIGKENLGGKTVSVGCPLTEALEEPVIEMTLCVNEKGRLLSGALIGLILELGNDYEVPIPTNLVMRISTTLGEVYWQPDCSSRKIGVLDLLTIAVQHCYSIIYHVVELSTKETEVIIFVILARRGFVRDVVNEVGVTNGS